MAPHDLPVHLRRAAARRAAEAASTPTASTSLPAHFAHARARASWDSDAGVSLRAATSPAAAPLEPAHVARKYGQQPVTSGARATGAESKLLAARALRLGARAQRAATRQTARQATRRLAAMTAAAGSAAYALRGRWLPGANL